MGSRDNMIDDERHDELLRRLLARSGQPAAVPPPPDLVTQTLRQLPREFPAVAGRAAARRHSPNISTHLVIGGEVDRTAVPRPRRLNLIAAFCDLVRRSATGIDRPDMPVSVLIPRIERDTPPVG